MKKKSFADRLGHRDTENADKNVEYKIMLGHRDTKNADRLGHRDIKNADNLGHRDTKTVDIKNPKLDWKSYSLGKSDKSDKK